MLGRGQPRSMETISELLGLIYDSVGDASRWSTFLEAFVHAVRGRRAGLLLRDLKRDEFTAVCWFGWPDEDIRLYLERYAPVDPWRVGGGSQPEGAVAADFDFCSREHMESSAAFREFYSPRDCAHGMGGVILVSGTGRSVISIVRGAVDGPFGESEKATLRALMPHLKRAALLHGELGSMRSQLATFTGHLDRYPHAFLLTDAERRVLYANAAAREFAELRDGLVIEAGQILLMSPRQDRVFRETIGIIASGRAPMHWLEVSRPSRGQPYRLMLMPVHASGVVPLGVSLPAVSVLIVDSESPAEPNLEVLRELFSLTPAEARIAGKLVLGRNVEEIAADAGISVETVRTHVKRVLSKTATDRQGELISLILRSIPFRQP